LIISPYFGDFELPDLDPPILLGHSKGIYVISKVYLLMFTWRLSLQYLRNNPLIHPPKTQHDSFPFDRIINEHFEPALDHAIKIAHQELKLITSDQANPTFENTILAIECCGVLMYRVRRIFSFLLIHESDNELKDIATRFSPKIAAFHHSLLVNKNAFRRVKTVYENRANGQLNQEQIRLVEDRYEWYEKNGANLPKENQDQLREIKMELTRVHAKFSKNLLNSSNSFEHHIINESELDGIPESTKSLMAKTAMDHGNDSGWMVLLQQPFVGPILTHCRNRNLRELVFRKSKSKAFNDEFDNQDTILKIAKLSHQLANLLGHETYADYVMQERMAGDIKTVNDFLEKIFKISKPKADEDMGRLRKYSDKVGGITELYGWDTGYYTEKLKSETFGFQEEDIKPFFELENVINGVFGLGKNLYGISVIRTNKIPTPHEDIRTYYVYDEDDKYLGQLWLDLHPRSTKRAGGWLSTLQPQGFDGNENKRPVVCIAANITPPANNEPSLLRLREVETLFHEFGHSLHHLLSDCTFKSLSGTNVYWDFVELPSQLMENFVLESEVLDLYAHHYKSGERIPQELVEKVVASKKFFAGKKSINKMTQELLDLAWYAKNPEEVTDVQQYETNSIKHTLLVPRADSSCASCSFSHIFAGGYAAGYYSYRWAQVLDADAFELFKEKGIFNKEVANSFRKNILAKGNTEHPMQLYKKFRGREPDSDALLLRSGLI
jgi:peptidyl-dipeptidase Dcp